MTQSPAGWYPQPDGRERYWDGAQWTEHFRMATPVAPPPPPPGYYAPQQTAAPKSRAKVIWSVVGGVVALLVVIGIIGAATGGDDDKGTKNVRTDATTGASPQTEKSQPADQPAPLTVESGFTTGVDSINTRYTSVGARLTNPNADKAAYDVKVLFNLIGKDGKILDTGSEDVPYVPSGGSFPVAGDSTLGFDMKQAPVKVEVHVTVGEFKDDEGPHGRFGEKTEYLKISSVRMEKDEIGINELAGEITNTTSKAVDLAPWSCIYLRGGQIVGGSSSLVTDTIPPGVSVKFSDSITIDVRVRKTECVATAD